MGLWQKHHTVADIFPIIVLQWNTGLGPRTRRLKHCLGLPGSYVPVRGNTGWNHSSWPDTIVTICMSYFTTGDPGKEHRTNKTSPTGRIWERSKGDPSPYVLPTSQKSSSLESILAVVCAIRKDADSEWNAKENPKTNPIIIKPKTESHVAKQSSWVPLPSCSSPMFPFPIKSLALSARVSPQTIYFEGLDKSPLLGPGRDLPSCNNLFIWIIWYVAFSG